MQVDAQGKFKEDNFQKAMAAAGDIGCAEGAASKQKKRTDRGEDSDIFKLARVLVERNLDPVRCLPLV
jgi:hypothetical protein